jgi:hypothetical protein
MALLDWSQCPAVESIPDKSRTLAGTANLTGLTRRAEIR